MLKKESILSGVYGLAIGDALGVPVEFLTRKMLDYSPVTGMRVGGTHKQPKGTWSDDTSMVLATMDAMSAGGLSYGMVMDNFVKWRTKAKYTATGEVFDIGGTTSSALHNYLTGQALERCGMEDEHSNGNGSLMRMLPMVYYVYLRYGTEVFPGAVGQIYRLSGLTHAHILSKVCCVYYVYVGVRLLRAGGKGDLHKIIEDAIEAVDRFYFVERGEIPCVPQITGMDSLTDCMEFPREDIDSSGFVLSSLIASLWCLWNNTSYEETVLAAVNLGSDTDTTGAIAGSLAGIWYGMGEIPEEWVNDLKNKTCINDICERFYNQYK